MAETLLLLSGRAASDPPIREDGQVGEFLTDLEGRMLVKTEFLTDSNGRMLVAEPALPVLTNVEGSLSLAQDMFSIEVLDSASMHAHPRNTGTATMTGGNFVFEGSLNSTDGVNGDWFALQYKTNLGNAGNSLSLTGISPGQGYTGAYQIPTLGVRWVRIRCTSQTTTGSIATWTVARSRISLEPDKATQAISGAVTVSGTPTVSVSGTPPVSVSSLPTGIALSRVSTASTNAVLIKSTAGSLYELSIVNPTATAAWLKLYNKSTVAVPGTDTPIAVVSMPANSVLQMEFGSIGKRFSSGISLAITGAQALLDTTNAVAGVQVTGTYT